MIENVPPAQVWEALITDPKAQLVDVRTDAEWNFVGLPDLAEAGKEPVLIPWQVYPSMQRNGAFTEHLRQAGLTPENKLYFLCRSGARSFAAAQAAQQAGFTHAYNVADGSRGRRTPMDIAARKPAGKPKVCPGSSGKQDSDVGSARRQLQRPGQIAHRPLSMRHERLIARAQAG